MTGTITNADTAASILFLGHNSEWWDSWLIVSGFLVALTAAAAHVAGFGAIVSHQREATAAEEALERYKLETAKELAEATARQKEAELQILRLRLPGSLDIAKFEAIVKKLPPPTSYEVLYDANAPDASFLASLIWGILFNAKWPTQQTTGEAPLKAFPPNILPYANMPWTQAAGGGPWGLSVVTTTGPDFDKDPLATGLAKALGESSKGPPCQLTLGYQTSEPPHPGAVRIIVGPKTP